MTVQSTTAGGRHEHLSGHEGKIAVFAWRGPDYIADEEEDEAGVGWILAEDWWPYQRPSFVTPPFAGYVSGHSTFSRAGAIVLGEFTGSEFFPGGLGEFHCRRNEFLVFEDGPSVDVTLQWATYKDASDQTSLSRIWGGIHPPADDIPGRHIGEAVGTNAYTLAISYFDGTVGDRTRFHRGDPNGTGSIDITDGIFIFNFLFLGEAAPTCRESADWNNDGGVDITDGIAVLNYLFVGSAAPAAPGPPSAPCGLDPDPQGSDNDLGCSEYTSCE